MRSKKGDAPLKVLPQHVELLPVAERKEGLQYVTEDEMERRASATEQRVGSLEQTLASVQESLNKVTAQLAAMGEVGLTAPQSHEHKVKMLLARNAPHHLSLIHI